MGLTKRSNQRGFNKRESTFRRNEKSSKGELINKDNTNASSCYGCGMPGHMLKDYPLIQKIVENQKFKIKKDNKKSNGFHME